MDKSITGSNKFEKSETLPNMSKIESIGNANNFEKLSELSPVGDNLTSELLPMGNNLTWQPEKSTSIPKGINVNKEFSSNTANFSEVAAFKKRLAELEKKLGKCEVT